MAKRCDGVHHWGNQPRCRAGSTGLSLVEPGGLGMPLWRRLTSGTATEKDFWRICRRRGQDLGDVGGSIVNQLKRSCFEHETKEFLVGFGFKGDRLSIETFVQKDFIWRQVLKARVTKDESIVHVADVFDEKMMIGKELFSGRNVRPLMRSPGFLVFPDRLRRLRCRPHSCGVVKSSGA